MTTENLQIIATARDMASATIKGLRANIAALGTGRGGIMGGAIGGLGMLGLGAIGVGTAMGIASKAIQGFTQFLGDGAASAIEEQKSLARLDTALQNNVTNWNGNRDAIDRAIEQRQDLAFEDDALRESLGKLVVLTKNETTALRYQSLAMNIARGRSIDLSAATDLVIKAGMGQVGMLRRVGIVIDKNATATEALALLERTYAGQTEAYLETLEGKAARAGIAMDELGEGIGQKTLPVFTAFVDQLNNDTIPALTDLSEFLTGSAEATNRFVPLLADAFRGIRPDISAALDDLQQEALDVERWKLYGEAWAEAVGDGFAAFDIKGQAIEPMVVDGLEAMQAATAVWKKAGGDAGASMGGGMGAGFMDGLADGLRSNKDFVENAMDDVIWALKHPMKQAKEVARIEGALTSDALARGLASESEGVREVSGQIRDDLIARWEALTGKTYTAFVNIANAAERGLGTFRAPRLGSLFGTNPNIGGGGGGGGGNRALGGDVDPGETYLIGERGPERLRMGNRGGGNITPNNALGNQTIHVVSANELARILDQGQGRRLALATSTDYVRG